MATKHKAPTEVLVAPVEERGAFFLFLERYWKLLTVGFVILGGAILYRAYTAEQIERSQDAGWEQLRRVVQVDTSFGVPRVTLATTPEGLEAMAQERGGGLSSAWALALAAAKHLEEGRFGKAAESADRLQQQFPNHALNREPWAFDDDGHPTSISEALMSKAKAFEAWAVENPGLFQNPAPPQDAPRARLETSVGVLEIALYPDKAPQHVENFLELVRSGFYDGTRFHRVIPGFMVQGGDPNSREMDPTTWGQGGPDYKIPREPNDLRHFPRAVAAAKMPGETESSGSQFYITLGSPHHLDGEHTVFGQLVGGEETLARIGRGESEPGSDRPKDPVIILSAQVLTD